MKSLSSSTFFPFYHRDFDFDDSIKQPCFHRESCVRIMGSIISFVFSRSEISESLYYTIDTISLNANSFRFIIYIYIFRIKS